MALFALMLTGSCQEKTSTPKILEEKPSLFPDYCGVTIPPNIAPLHFQLDHPAERVRAQVKDRQGNTLTTTAKEVIGFKSAPWKKMLLENMDDSLFVTLQAKYKDSGWVEYAPFTLYISAVPVDNYLVYRLIAPGYEVFSKMGIYQRNLTSFKETPILENTLVPGNCMNCHSFPSNSPEDMSLHIRGALGGTIIKKGYQTEMINTKADGIEGNCVYPYWHPSGEYIVYSVNQTVQVFHAIQDKRVEVVDLASDVVVYHPGRKEIITSPLLQTEDFETFPSFSPDGKTLYFSSSKFQKIPENYQEVRYNLCSISFDPESGTFGNRVDTLIDAASMGKSISFAKPSPNGEYIMFTLSDYGNFSIWHKEADLWMYNLKEKTMYPLTEANSPDVESYHSWSSESTWFVFSSRRMDGLYTRPFIASIDKNGNSTKPFLLPVRNPLRFYSFSFFSYNVPEFVTDKVTWNVGKVEKLLTSPKRQKVTLSN